jgi:fumarate hydratase class II
MMNAEAGRLPLWKAAAIARAADDLIAGRLADQFPLPNWHAGSTRYADTNVNEVLANRAAQLLGATIGGREPVGAARDVNMGQSLEGIFTAAMYIATVIEIEEVLVPRCSALARAIERNPGQASGLGRRLRTALGRLDEAEGSLHEISACPADEATSPDISATGWQLVVGIVGADTARPFIVAPDAYSERGSIDAMLAAMAAVRGLAIVLLDVADAVQAARDDNGGAGVRVQIEAMAMVCRYVIGQDQMVVAAACDRSAASVARPFIVAAVINSLCRLSEGCEAVRRAIARPR